LIAKWTKKSDIVKKQRKTSVFNNIFCVTENQDLVERLRSHFKREVIKIDKQSLMELKFSRDYIIFDKDYLKVAEVISAMKQHSDSENFFRIKLSTLNVLIGSDSSTSQGECIKF
jgi:hypothetical protein